MFSSLLNAVCDIKRRALVPDGMGGHTPGDYTVIVAQNVPCHVGGLSARARFQSKGALENIDTVADLIIFMDYRTDVQERDRCTVQGRNYDVGYVKDPGLLHHHLELSVTIVK